MKKNLIGLSLLVGLFLPLCAAAQLVYHDAAEFPLYGKAVEQTYRRYTRLPESLKGVTRDPVWNLGLNSAGLAIRFRSNSTTIAVRWKNSFGNSMNHMTPTGIRGLDLYARVGKGWRFVNSARPNGSDNEATIISTMLPEEREFILYLPLYDGVDSLSIGVDATAEISVPRLAEPVREKPIVFYGTSILQGGCATRPGMAHTNILSRRLNREAINLGFSGNGQLDLEIAELMAEIDAGVFVLDFVPNVTVEQMETKMIPFYRILRERHPDTPVIFIEDPRYPHGRFDKRMAEEVRSKNETVNRIFGELKKKGEKHIYMISSERMLGDDAEATVDGVHFTDLGMMRYADLVCPVIRRHLKR